MTRTEEGLKTTRDCLAKLQRALASLEAERPKYHPSTYEVLAEPIREDIEKLQAEIDEYLQAKAKVPHIAEEQPIAALPH